MLFCARHAGTEQERARVVYGLARHAEKENAVTIVFAVEQFQGVKCVQAK